MLTFFDRFAIPTLKLLVVIFVGAGLGNAGYALYQSGEKYLSEKNEKEKRTEELLSLQQEEIEKLKIKSDEADARAEVFEKKLIAEKTALEKKLVASQKREEDSSQRLSVAVQVWRNKVGRLSCEWRTNGFLEAKTLASGFITKDSDGTIIILTNRHVIISDNREPSSCTLSFPSGAEPVTIPRETNTFKVSTTGFDWGVITVPAPNDYVRLLAKKTISEEKCLARARTGEEMVILGYPGIGSQSDITATEGIVSGYEDNHYITSAKVERGNSGGAAISVKGSCYLGVPTFVESGQLESLARVLDVETLFNK